MKLSTILMTACMLWVGGLSAAPEAAVADGGAVTATDLLQAFKRDATAARQKYYDKKVEVSGMLDSITPVTGGEALTLEIAAVCRVKRKSTEIEELKLKMKEESARMDKAKEWAREYERDRRKRLVQVGNDWDRNGVDSRLYKEYNDSMNPNGPRGENQIIVVTFSGVCKGIRSGKIFMDECTDISYETRKGDRLEAIRKKE